MFSVLLCYVFSCCLFSIIIIYFLFFSFLFFAEAATEDIITKQLPAIAAAKARGEISPELIDVFCEKVPFLCAIFLFYMFLCISYRFFCIYIYIYAYVSYLQNTHTHTHHVRRDVSRMGVFDSLILAYL